MARRSKYFKVVEHLLDTGYESKDICKISGIPRATVYRIVDKLREEAKINFKELMEKDYLYKYQRNLEELSKTVVECNEEIVKINARYDELERQAQEMLDAVEPNKHVSKSNFMTNLISCRSGRTTEISKLISQRDKASEAKASLYNKGPVVYRINEFVTHKLPNVPPMLNKGITVGEAPMNVPELNVISDDDKAILDEMEQDEN